MYCLVAWNQLIICGAQLWASVYGEKHLETVKAITMIGTLLHRLQGAQAGMEWYRKELKIREELQGEMHPRTQQARRMFTSLLDAKLQVTFVSNTYLFLSNIYPAKFHIFVDNYHQCSISIFIYLYNNYFYCCRQRWFLHRRFFVLFWRFCGVYRRRGKINRMIRCSWDSVFLNHVLQ